MPDRITEYKCPACGGSLKFDSATGKVKCEFCDSIFEPEYIEQLYAKKDETAANEFNAAAGKQDNADEWDMSGMTDDWGVDKDNLRAYNCPSCGAQLICDSTTAATSCPYCGSPTIVPGQLSGTLKPDFVIPFKLDKNAAVAALKKHYSGKHFLPGSFTNANHIQQIRGIYVPFWLFDGVADADMTFATTRTHVHRRGNEEITNTGHFVVRRAGMVSFSKVPVDGSSKMPDDLMDSIEPFNYGELTPFSTAYLPGYLADKYDVSAADCSERADLRCVNSTATALRDTVVGYATCVETSRSIELHRGKVHYALLPVWILNTKFKGKDFIFAMNGQTGKLVGDLPMNWGKFWGVFSAITAGLTAVITAVQMLLL